MIPSKALDSRIVAATRAYMGYGFDMQQFKRYAAEHLRHRLADEIARAKMVVTEHEGIAEARLEVIALSTTELDDLIRDEAYRLARSFNDQPRP